MYFGIDAGGSGTAVVVKGEAGHTERRRFGPISPAAVGDVVAHRNLVEALCVIAGLGDESRHFGWIGTSAIFAMGIAEFAARLSDCASEAGLKAIIAACDDPVVPLLGPPLMGQGMVVVAGTGSVIVGCAPDGTVVRRGGHEYVISDEGSGFDVGRRGLRAAIQSVDCTGPETGLLQRSLRMFGVPTISGLGAQLANNGFPKAPVAAFAKEVCDAAETGDAAASKIVESATSDLAALSAAALAALPHCPRKLVVIGSLAGESRAYRDALLVGLKHAIAGVEVTFQTDALAPALALAEELCRLSDHLPARVRSFPHARVAADPVGGSGFEHSAGGPRSEAAPGAHGGVESS